MNMKRKHRKTHTPFRLEAQLKRAGNLSLCVNFTCYRSTEEEFVLLAILVQHSARWEEVRLHVPVSRFSDL
ncbi:hypothetical protein B0H12DRAFT_1047399, partial [Mycena haematopus]